MLKYTSTYILSLSLATPLNSYYTYLCIWYMNESVLNFKYHFKLSKINKETKNMFVCVIMHINM